MVVTENKITWAKSCMEREEKETEIFKMMGSLDDAKRGGGDRNRIKKIFLQFREKENEEHETRASLETMQKNVNEAHARASETLQRLFKEIEE